MKVLGQYDGMHGLVATPQPNPQFTESNRKLDALYARALPLAERLILEYVAKLDTDEPLDAAYAHTFGEFLKTRRPAVQRGQGKYDEN